MTREENLHWIDQEIQTWENECQSKHPIKESLHAARKALEQEPCNDAVSVASVFEIMGNLMSIPYDFDRSITEKDVSESMDKVRELPRVTPQEPRIGKLIGYIDFLRNTAQGKKKSLNLLEKVVKGELEEIQAEGENFVEPRTGEWIPVTERLPEENGGYLVTVKRGYVTTALWVGNAKNWEEVTAWMPLPQPYKAESEVEE